MSEHTPGPWTVNLGKKSGGIRGVATITADSGDDVAVMGWGNVHAQNAAANAHLIAAAPELLEALEEAVTYSRVEPSPEVLRGWMDAIAKARGQS